MGSIFTFLYGIFSDMFGTPLATYLSGQTSATGDNQYVFYGMAALFVSLLLAAIFYYLLASPRLARTWFWAANALVCAAANFLIGWLYTLSDLNAGLMAITDPETGESVTQVTAANCLLFGVADAVWGAVFFFLCSMAIKWWSPMACRTPF